MLERQQKRNRRHKRIRAKIKGIAKIPRFCIFRSNRHIYAQLIDDEKGKTLIVANDQEVKGRPHKTASRQKQDKDAKDKKDKIMTGKVAVAYEIGKLIAEKASKKKIEKAVFDRGGYKYHGKVKALAEGAREGGLKF